VRIAILSDVHSNLPALDAVLRHAGADGAVDALWVTGDVVGYGAQPAEVLARLLEHNLVAVVGNHDLVACGGMDAEEFNSAAARAASWTRDHLDGAERECLAGLPSVHREGDFTLVHGSLRDPVWEYLLSAEQALVQLELQQTPYSVVGHSHIPFAFEDRPDQTPHVRRVDGGTTLALGETRVIVNPGSVGQPRDGDPRAAYLLYDDGAATLTWHRVDYDIEAAQEAIVAAGLPSWLAHRLSEGR
jgi:diadenosine tetraphosphatase ApaH/serine/threonine PP2A family protein phosphatase